MSEYKATPEQIKKAKEKLEEALKFSESFIKDLIENYETSMDDINEFLLFQSRFRKYSPRNIALIFKQLPNATFCASFKDWKDKSANILKGSKGATILVPKKLKYIYDVKQEKYIQWKDADKELIKLAKIGKADVREKIVYGNGTVFDISQTDFPREQYPNLYSVGVASKAHAALFEMLSTYITNIGGKVEVKNLESISLRGYYDHDDNGIVINLILDDTAKLSTLSHEFGHMIVKHKPNDVKSLALTEIEGDILSILFYGYFGLEVEDTRKNHFKDHIEKYKNELNEDENISTAIISVMNSCYDIYKKHALDLDVMYNEHYSELENVFDEWQKLEDEFYNQSIQ